MNPREEAEHFGKLVSKFIKDHEERLPKDILKKIVEISNYTLALDIRMDRSQSAISRVRYLKRGINMVGQFMILTDKKLGSLDEFILNCRVKLLGGKVVKRKTVRAKEELIFCSEPNLKKAKKDREDFEKLQFDILGCDRQGKKLFISYLSSINSEKILGKDYSRKIRQLSNKCLDIRVDRLKR